MAAFRFRHEIPVRWSDIDSVGVLNNAKYLTYFEQARYEYSRQLGLLVEGQFPYVLGETSVRFLQPGRPGMLLTVATRTTRLGTKSFAMDYEIRHQENLLATATATLVYVNPTTLKSCPIPDRDRRSIAGFEDIAAG